MNIRQEISLYLNGQQVDLNDNGGIYFNYKQKDVKNPTVVKNSFSKTLTIPGTDNNNNIFNNIWDLTRVQTTDIVPYFNQSKRVPFELFLNGEVVEQGYCKLDRIRRDKVKEYDLSLFGGLGDFFYNLAYNSDTGEKRTLADLDFGEDLTFTINKETIKDAWDNLKAGSASTISFAPAYNGVPDVLDADKVLVNTNNFRSNIMVSNQNGVWSERTGFPNSESGYTTVYGYGLAELPEPITEWKIRDIRSYLQRPVLSVPRLLDAIGNPDNNGGYSLELDPYFFNDSNPYYKDAWITLPMITELDVNKETSSSAITVTVVDVQGTSRSTTIVDLSDVGECDELNMSIKLKCGSTVPPTASTLYTSVNITNYLKGKLYGGFGVQLVGLDANNTIVAGSNVWWLTTDLGNGDYLKFSDIQNGIYNGTFRYYDRVDTSLGTFVKNGNEWEWPTDLEFTLKSNVSISKYQIRIVAGASSNINGMTVYVGNMFTTSSCRSDQLAYNTAVMIFNPAINSAESSSSSDINTYSDIVVSKESILSSDYTPADYLLSYCKLFNLYFDKDVTKKTVKVMIGRNFYNGEVDLTYDIDRNVDINPLTFEHKWYSFKHKENNTHALSNYKAKYGVDFGSQRINTGYEFDSETEELLKDNIFSNAVQVLEASKYYQKINTRGGEDPSFLINNVTYDLFNNSTDRLSMEISKSNNATTQDINTKSNASIKYDSFSKVQLHSQEKPAKGANILLFYNGIKTTQPNYFITDDLSLMQQLNEKPCWLYTIDEYDTSNNQIAIRTNELPQFSRYIEDENYIYCSWDFGRTRELFIPEIAYVDGDATIYERYWKAYINDLYDVDTRIVTAYIKFDEKPTKESLKHFYYFENSFWVIDEIIDYNPTTYGLTKVKFVKVNDKDNYLNDNIIPPTPFLLTISSPTPIPATATTLTFTITAAKPARIKLVGSTLPQDLYCDVFAGTTTSGFTIPANTHNYVEYFNLTAWLIDDISVVAHASVEQLGNEGPTLTGITLDNVAWVTDVPATGGTASYQNCTYTVTAHYSDGTSADITSQSTFTASTTLNVPATTSTTRENVGVINVIAEYYDGPNPFSSTVVVPVYQAAVQSPERYVTLNLVYTGNTTSSFPVITATVANVAPQSWTPTYIGETYDMVFSAGQVTDSTIMVTAVDQVPPYLTTISGGLRGGSYSDTDTGTGQAGITMQINFSFGQSTIVQFYCDITGYDNN